MVIITGGAYQGKSTFIKNRYPESRKKCIDGNEASFDDILKASCVFNFDAWIRKEVEKTPRDEWGKLEERMALKALEIAEKNPKVIIELPEVGLGLVPMDALDRCTRECIGRMGCSLVEKAEEVYRLMMGVPMQIKGV